MDVYTDGSHKNGVGGWAVYVPDDDFIMYGYANHTTSNRMELQAVIEALMGLKGDLVIHSDSKYVVDGINRWLECWKRWDWQKVNGKLKNKDLWKITDALIQDRVVTMKWIKAHSGHIHNDIADHLANTARQQKLTY